MKLNQAITFEKVGDEILAFDVAGSSVLSITGPGALVVGRLLDGGAVGKDDEGVDELIDVGVILPEVSGLVSRRSLVTAGAALGATGVLVLGLPTAAYASSAFLLPAPSFNFTSGIILSSTVSTGGVSGARTITFLEFPATRLANSSDYPSGFVLEWSLTAASGFEEEFEFRDLGGGDLRFDWVGSVAAGSNYAESNDRLTLHIRARSGTSVSESVEVEFDND
jgi:hypothetical protein